MRRVSPRAFESINSSWFCVHAQMLMYLLISASNFLLLPTRRRAFWQLCRYKCEKDKWLITGLFNAEAGETPSFRRRYRRLKRRGSPRCWWHTMLWEALMSSVDNFINYGYITTHRLIVKRHQSHFHSHWCWNRLSSWSVSVPVCAHACLLSHICIGWLTNWLPWCFEKSLFDSLALWLLSD